MPRGRPWGARVHAAVGRARNPGRRESEMMEREVVGQRRNAKRKTAKKGVAVPRYFSTPGVDPAEEIAWELRTAAITALMLSLIHI